MPGVHLTQVINQAISVYHHCPVHQQGANRQPKHTVENSKNNISHKLHVEYLGPTGGHQTSIPCEAFHLACLCRQHQGRGGSRKPPTASGMTTMRLSRHPPSLSCSASAAPGRAATVTKPCYCSVVWPLQPLLRQHCTLLSSSCICIMLHALHVRQHIYP